MKVDRGSNDVGWQKGVREGKSEHWFLIVENYEKGSHPNVRHEEVHLTLELE